MRTIANSIAIVGVISVALLSGCSATGASPTARASGSASASADSAAAAVRFTTTTFTHPFSFTVPSWAPATPSSETSNFVTWEAPDGGLKLRVMAPVVIYTPNALFTPNATPDPIPADYSSYFLGLADHGVHFTDVVHRVISGHQAVVVTGTTNDPKDGSLGCPTLGMSSSDCFAFQPDLVLRLADIDDNGAPVLVWLRADSGAKNFNADAAAFDKTLDTLSFTG